MDRARRGAGLDGVDHDRPIEADHALHQPEPAPIVLGDLDVGAIGQPLFQFLDHPQPDAVVGHQGVAEAEDESFHGLAGREKSHVASCVTACENRPPSSCSRCHSSRV